MAKRRDFSAAADEAKWLVLRRTLLQCDTTSLCDADTSVGNAVLHLPRRSALGAVPKAMVGRAVTVCPVSSTDKDLVPDLRFVVDALKESCPGQVLVIDAKESRYAVAGELFCAEAKRRGLAGMVINGACRDVHTLSRSDFPVYSLSISPNAGMLSSPEPRLPHQEHRNVPVTIGGLHIRPGDVLFADADGCVNLGKDLAHIEELAQRSSEIQRHEDRVFLDVTENGCSLFEFMNTEDEDDDDEEGVGAGGAGGGYTGA